jgi:hypothetical protein
VKAYFDSTTPSSGSVSFALTSSGHGELLQAVVLVLSGYGEGVQVGCVARCGPALFCVAGP